MGKPWLPNFVDQILFVHFDGPPIVSASKTQSRLFFRQGVHLAEDEIKFHIEFIS
jgi:hypothetical protein